MIAAWLPLPLALGGAPDDLHAPMRPMETELRRMDPIGADDRLGLPPRVERGGDGPGTTIFVNFDGVTVVDCPSPGDSHSNCTNYNTGPFEPYSGSTQTRVGILQAMRQDASDFGIRITGVRPPNDENYVMVVYGGTAEDFDGALGSALAGDCLDGFPNQLAFAHVDGELADWVNGGATTALHEAGHTWGLSHIDTAGAIMFPSGDNGPTSFRDACDRVVDNTALDSPAPEDLLCPEVNMQFCGDPGLQNPTAILSYLFGPPYVDSTPPTVDLAEPRDGEYFQGPVDFDIVLEIEDDQHPQPYSIWAWTNDDPQPAEPSLLAVTTLKVTDLPLGSWAFHLIVADSAGNQTRLDFDIEVGKDPPPDPEEGCGCRAGGVSGTGAARWWAVLVLTVMARRRRQG
jgi:hypothetical protein